MKASLFVKACALGALVSVTALGGCGRKGPLDPPSSARTVAPAEAADPAMDRPPSEPSKPDRPFLLDPLI